MRGLNNAQKKILEVVRRGTEEVKIEQLPNNIGAIEKVMELSYLESNKKVESLMIVIWGQFHQHFTTCVLYLRVMRS